MAEILNLITGAVLLLLIMYDFFFTTLSGSGQGFISKSISGVAHRFIQAIVKMWGRGMYDYSGMIVNLLVVAVWVIIVWIGLYLVFSYQAEHIVNNDGRMANNWERLYFTGYTLSTLGLGNFQPVTPFSEILTSIFSFFGFIFFTSSMTYLISVSSAVTNKRSLSRSIQNLGKDPVEIAKKLVNLNISYSYQQILTLQEMIDRHAVNHQAYPVVHFYSHSRPEVCLSINLVRLDEAISLLLNTDNGREMEEELQLLRSSLDHFLNYLKENFTSSLPMKELPPETIPVPYVIPKGNRKALQQRRQILGGLLRSESFRWEDVSKG